MAISDVWRCTPERQSLFESHRQRRSLTCCELNKALAATKEAAESEQARDNVAKAKAIAASLADKARVVRSVRWTPSWR
jgi:hypothetical protein